MGWVGGWCNAYLTVLLCQIRNKIMKNKKEIGDGQEYIKNTKIELLVKSKNYFTVFTSFP